MNITPQEIRHLEELSRIQIDPAEETVLLCQIEEILTYFSDLDTLELPAETETLIQENCNHMRRDSPTPCMDRETLLYNAPKKENGCFLVPNIMEQEEP